MALYHVHVLHCRVCKTVSDCSSSTSSQPELTNCYCTHSLTLSYTPSQCKQYIRRQFIMFQGFLLKGHSIILTKEYILNNFVRYLILQVDNHHNLALNRVTSWANVMPFLFCLYIKKYHLQITQESAGYRPISWPPIWVNSSKNISNIFDTFLWLNWQNSSLNIHRR